jgi:hypothetical protein
MMRGKDTPQLLTLMTRIADLLAEVEQAQN